MKYLITSIFVACAFSAFSQQPAKPIDWKTITDAKYKIQYPTTWELNQNAGNGTSFVLFGRNVVEAKFRENINLIIQDLSAYKMDLVAYAKLSEDQVKTAIANGKILKSMQVKDKGVTYHMMIYEGDFQQYKLKWKQYYYVENNTAYVLTFTATQETYDEFLPMADRILNSFSLVK